MHDSGKGNTPSDTPRAPGRGAARTRAATWASDDVLPALSGRAAELEALARSLQTDLDRVTQRVAASSEFDDRLEHSLVGAYRGAEEIQRKARVEADRILERALDERRIVLHDVDRLRSEGDGLANEIAFARRGRLMSVSALPERGSAAVPDHRVLLAAEMRVMFEALLRETFGPRPAPAKPIATARPPATLLRAPLAAARKRRESSPPREVAPQPRSAAIVEAILQEVPRQTPERADEVSETVVPLAQAGAEMLEEIAAAIETPTDLSRPRQLTPPLAPALDEAETPVITRSDDVSAVAEPVYAAVPDEAVEPREDPRAIALALGQTPSPAMRDIPREAGAELPLEPPRAAPLLSHIERVEPAVELDFADHIDVLDPGPLEAQEMVEEIPFSPLLVEPVVATPTEAAAITDLWQTALGPTPPDQRTVKPSSVSLASSVEMATGPAAIDSRFVITKAASIAETAPADVAMAAAPTAPQGVVAQRRAVRELQLVLSPITSFPQLLAIQHRIASLSSVNALHLRDFRNGVATFAAGVTEALSGREFGSVLQMVVDLGLRLQGATENSVELRVEPQAL